eukprot:scaffold25406_cov117-Cylindrotheca_fusiformis.AAC.2
MEDPTTMFEPIPISVSSDHSQRPRLRAKLEETVHLLFRDPSSGLQQRPPTFVSAWKEAEDSPYLPFPLRLTDSPDIFSPSSTLDVVPSDVDTFEYKEKSGNKPVRRYRQYQEDLWETRFNELLEFKRQHHHCNVPHIYPPNQALGSWVKRQRHQYKQRNEGYESTMTEKRIEALSKVGFMWGVHSATWEIRFNELKEYLMEHGNCNVPTHYSANRTLATWVKCQRRQYKLFRANRASSLTVARIMKLNRIGFTWEVRGSWKQRKH